MYAGREIKSVHDLSRYEELVQILDKAGEEVEFDMFKRVAESALISSNSAAKRW